MFSIILVSIPNGIALIDQYLGTFLTLLNLRYTGGVFNSYVRGDRKALMNRNDYRWSIRLTTVSRLGGPHETTKPSVRPKKQ
uniref:Cytochrome-c oxidase n=1 Tax=Angiostrongylus cantonensis TaxID=6313 RepID=A0A0K0DQJ5_ANGCA